MKYPKISIVTPSLNQGKYIEQTIKSVIDQNYPNLEYIIIDGGSTDDTLEIIKKYEQWITYWVSEPDNGQSHAINKGIEKCTGDIFNWLNSDDYYTPGSLFQVAEAFLNDASLLVVSGFENHIGLDGKYTFNEGTFLKVSLEETIEFCQVAQPSTFFRLSTVRQIGGVSEDLLYIMDGEMWVKLLLRYGQNDFKKIEKVLVNFRLHPDSKTVSDLSINNFLNERSSIITDLQRYVGVPIEIVNYYTNQIYQSGKVYHLNREWSFNENILTKRKLRIYFIKKYIINQFIGKNKEQAFWGLKQLIINKAFDLYLLKGFAKLLIKI